MNDLFNSILVNVSEEISVSGALVTMLAALVSGGIIACTYKKTQTEELYQRSLALSLLMLPTILAVIILFVGSNVARAFSLAGTLSIIRFRSAPGDAKDISYIFFDVAAGLACGVGLYGYGLMFVLILCAVMLISERAGIFMPREKRKILKVTIPEDLNSSGAFDDIFEKYTASHRLTKIKTTDLGSLYELSYSISMTEAANEQDFINELRTRNGNLTIMLSEAVIQ